MGFKIHLLSDLHLEFDTFTLPNVDADVLVLAGDISNGLHGIRTARGWSRERPVVMVAGNHDFYSQSFPSFVNTMQLATVGYPNLHFLENGFAIIDGVRFLGATLWTDFELYGIGTEAQSRLRAEKGMNDFFEIMHDEGRPLRPLDTLKAHRENIEFLNSTLAEPFDQFGKTVVVTHHAPTIQAIHPRFTQRHDGLSPAFASNLEHMMGPQVNAWLSGHTHYNYDIDIHGTRCVSNARGYPGEEIKGFDARKVIEI